MEEEELIRFYKDRLRIFLILFFFSEDYSDPENSTLKKIFKSEIRIQAIDFLLRNPDYFAYELLYFIKEGKVDADEVQPIIKQIFRDKEPTIRKLEMEILFYGAYEDIDDVISFLKSVGLIEYRSKVRRDMKVTGKEYYLTKDAIDKVEKNLRSIASVQWYIQRCELIKKYFGKITGSKLKISQHKIDEYHNTAYGEHIKSITKLVKEEYQKQFGEVL
ncbi:MAG: hypothetical protein D3922_17065 [Candidatus Electrothrix sp. AR1]|nr:hypothetical protein [Candidatus Electrothrix sp. AR1]